MKDDPIVESLLRTLDLVKAEGLPYMVMGGIAVRTWGLPRSTVDVDLTLAMPVERVAAFCRSAEAAGFSVPEPHMKGFADSLKGMLKFSILDTFRPRHIEVDLFLVSTPYQKEAFSRRREVDFETRALWMISPEDLILHKLLAGRPKDFSDIDDILLVQGSVDRAYLERWAGSLGVQELLDERIPKG